MISMQNSIAISTKNIVIDCCKCCPALLQAILEQLCLIRCVCRAIEHRKSALQRLAVWFVSYECFPTKRPTSLV